MPLLVIFKIIIVLLITGWALKKVLSGAPYMPTSKAQIDLMLKRTQPLAGLRVADIGAGDGRIVMAFARTGAEAVGIEHNYGLTWIARRRIQKEKLDDKASIRCTDLWKTNFSSFDIVVVFGITHIMPKLEKKLLKELKSGARVYSIVFQFPNWKPSWSEGGVNEYTKQ